MRHERTKPGGVADTAEKLAKKQAEGWTTARSIHPDARSRARKRERNTKTFSERLTKAVARSQRDQEARGGMKTKSGK